MQDPRGELFRVYWGFTASREAAHKFGTLTEPFQWEQGGAQGISSPGDRAGSWVLGGSDKGLA